MKVKKHSLPRFSEEVLVKLQVENRLEKFPHSLGPNS